MQMQPDVRAHTAAYITAATKRSKRIAEKLRRVRALSLIHAAHHIVQLPRYDAES